MVTIEDIEIWIRENGDTEGFFSTEALVNHFVNMSKVEFINKACNWLKHNAKDFTYISAHSGDAKINEYKLIEEFEKAMEG